MNHPRRTPDVLKRTAELTGPALRAAVDRLSPGLAAPARYHFGWVDSDGRPHPKSRHGKGVRPTLALLSAEAVGASPPNRAPRRGRRGIGAQLFARARRHRG